MRSLLKAPLGCLAVLGGLAVMIGAVWLLEMVGRGAGVLGVLDIAFAVILVLATAGAGLGAVAITARRKGLLPPAGQVAAAASSGPVEQAAPRRRQTTFTPAHLLVDRSDTWRSAAGLGLFALAWNGLTWGIFLLMRRDGGVPFFATLILALFMVIGGLLVLAVLAKCWTMLHYAPGELAMERWPLRLGDDPRVVFRRRIKRRFTVRAIEARLTCRESARYRRGTDVTTVKERVWEQTLAPERVITTGPLIEGIWVLHIPPSLPPSFKSANNAIEWELEVRVRASGGPSANAEFALSIAPEVVV